MQHFNVAGFGRKAAAARLARQSLVIVRFILAAAAIAAFATAARAQQAIEFSPAVSGRLGEIATGSDNKLWFTETNVAKIGTIKSDGSGFAEFNVPSGAFTQPSGITAGPDGALWFTEAQGGNIGRITTAGVVSEFLVMGNLGEITSGPDGALWFTGINTNKIGRIATNGTNTQFTIPTALSGPQGIATGSDGALWFVERLANKIGRVTTSGVFTEFAIPTASSNSFAITPGPDGALWFTETNAGKIGRITTAGAITEFPTIAVSFPVHITAGPDGALWFDGNGKIGRIATDGTVTALSTPSGGALGGVTVGPVGTIWFTESVLGKIGKLATPTLSVTAAGTGNGQVTSIPAGINCGPSGNACSTTVIVNDKVTLTASAKAGSTFVGWSGVAGCGGTAPCQVTMGGDVNVTATFTLIPSSVLTMSPAGAGSGTVTSSPSGINCAPTCAASFQTGTQVTLTAAAASGSTFTGWSGGGCSGVAPCTVTLTANTAVAATFVQDTPGNLTLVAAVLPDSRSVQIGNPATAFATMINVGPGAASACMIMPATSVPATFAFQTTNPATNALSGTVNTPIDIAASQAQTFVVALTPTAAFAPTDLAFTFTCANAPSPAASTVGVDTLNLSGSASPVPDIVALAASGDPGRVDIPGATGTGVFAVATVNLGIAASITASADTGMGNLPVGLTLCQTDPTSGTCLATPSPTVTTQIAANATPTFGIFVTGAMPIADLPGINRVFVRFTDSGGVLRGATSVAVRTQ